MVPTIFALGVLRALLWFTCGGILPPLYSIVSLNAKVQNQRGIMAIASSLTSLGNLIGPLLSGLLSPVIGLRGVLLAITGLLLGLSLLAKLKMQEQSSLTRSSEERAVERISEESGEFLSSSERHSRGSRAA